MPIMRVEGEEPLSPDSKGLESVDRGPSSLRAHGIKVMSYRTGGKRVRPTPST
jgi:hypothetical protein